MVDLNPGGRGRSLLGNSGGWEPKKPRLRSEVGEAHPLLVSHCAPGTPDSECSGLTALTVEWVP